MFVYYRIPSYNKRIICEDYRDTVFLYGYDGGWKDGANGCR